MDKQPIQLELFRLTEAPYTNAFEFYEAIPRFLAGGDKAKYVRPDGSVGEIKRNTDGTTIPIERFYIHRGKGYNLSIAPAQVKAKTSSGYKSVFPGVREEIIEFVIFKLAIDRGFFTDGEGENAPRSDNYVVFTTVYEIQQELKKRSGGQHPSYNYTQIMEALEILSDTKYVIKGETKEESFRFSPFVEFGHMTEKDRQDRSKEKNATLYIKLNSLVAKSILAKSWRQIGYDTVIQDDSFLGRWFRKTLSLRFTQADATKTYNILLSTVINQSGISPTTALRANLQYVQGILESLDIVSKVTVQKEWEINPATKRKRMVDAKFVIWPSKAFVEEQIQANTHSRRVEAAMEGQGGEAVLEPRRDDYASNLEFQQARRNFLAQQAEQIK